MRVVSGTRYYWVRQYNGTSDTLYTEDVTNAGPGIYRFVVEQGKYCSAEHSFYMADNSPNISESLAKVVNPSCGLNNGSISSIFVNGIYHRLIWKDSVGNEIANQAEVNNLGPGRYK